MLILGCTAEYGIHERMQDSLGVPVIDAVLAPFKYAEMPGEMAERRPRGVHVLAHYRTPG